METFEIHITGEESINTELDSMNIKNIIVELLTPEKNLLRTEYMSSFMYKCESYQECKRYVDELVSISKNRKSGKLMGTDRCYLQEDYVNFIQKWKDVEMCLFDSFVEEDFDWFDLYKS